MDKMGIFEAKPSLFHAPKKCLDFPPFSVEFEGTLKSSIRNHRDKLVFFVRPSRTQVNSPSPESDFSIFDFFARWQPSKKAFTGKTPSSKLLLRMRKR